MKSLQIIFFILILALGSMSGCLSVKNLKSSKSNDPSTSDSGGSDGFFGSVGGSGDDDDDDDDDDNDNNDDDSTGDDDDDDDDNDSTGNDDDDDDDDSTGDDDDDDDNDDDDVVSPPLNPDVPSPTSSCPTLRPGTNNSILGVSVELIYDSARVSNPGPLVIYWHASAGNSAQASAVLAQALNEIKQAGGVVAAPNAPTGLRGPTPNRSTGPIEWREADVKLADEIAACASQQLSIDPKRIHHIGFSAGALQAAFTSLYTSRYVASVATLSGGTIYPAPENLDSAHKFSAIIFHGGSGDQVGIGGLPVMKFKQRSEAYHQILKDKQGHFALLCNHGLGHQAPAELGKVAWDFLKAHPFGTNPSPYAGNLPAELRSICSAD